MSKPRLIRRRHVFYVAGYDPQGADGYYAVFQREFERFKKLWPVRGTLTPPEIDARAHSAHWMIETAAPNWQVSTRYEFMNMDDIIRRDLARPMCWRLPQVLIWLCEQIASGTLVKVFRRSWPFGLFMLYPVVGIALWAAAAVLGGWTAWRVAGAITPSPIVDGLLGIAVAMLLLQLSRPLADRWFVVQLMDLWLSQREFDRGQRADIDERFEHYAERLVAVARAAEADEIVVVGHSGGAVSAALLTARALALDPALGRHGPRIVLMTLGSIMPAVAFAPQATRVCGAIRTLALARDLLWIDCQTHRDVMNFYDFDPVAGVGIDIGPERRNPTVLLMRSGDVLAPDTYASFRWNFFRLHFQFIMANDIPALYDYYLYLCGPAPIEDWAKRAIETFTRFGEDASFAPLAAKGKPGFVTPAERTV